MKPGFDPWVRKIPWRRAWYPTPAFFPGQSPWTEEPGGLQSMGSQKVRHDWATKQLIKEAECMPSHLGDVWLFHAMNYSLPGSSVHEILQARILEWGAMHPSRESSWPRDQTHISCVSCITSIFFPTALTGKPSKAERIINILLHLFFSFYILYCLLKWINSDLLATWYCSSITFYWINILSVNTSNF